MPEFEINVFASKINVYLIKEFKEKISEYDIQTTKNGELYSISPD
jgi:hypothetical protein